MTRGRERMDNPANTYCHCGFPKYKAPPLNLADDWYMVATGWKKFKVIGYCGDCHTVLVEYESGVTATWQVDRLVPVPTSGGSETKENANEKGTSDMKTLYEINTDGTINFGYKLAVNSAGKWVMEVKETGAIVAVDKANVTEVMPYTVDINYVGRNTALYSFFAKAGDFAENDLVYLEQDDAMVKVVKVDTKSRKATRWLVGWKISADYVAGEE